MQVTAKTAKDLGLQESEFEQIKTILGRDPNFTELSIYSAMWSEHCSYKNSIRWLKTLPRKGKHLLVEAGEENAGLVDLGDGYACAFKIESHNHPSALEPYQGAATGVGGIHRDIFTMGARPVCALNSLRFGDLKDSRTQYLLKGVVKGIGDYGNCFGVPTVAGEVFFDPVYHTNPLVNAMSVGVVKTGETCSATAGEPGNAVYIIGSATGKDGIHGAAFASKELTGDSVNDLPAVQVGDPFQEKLLLEATLEIIKTGAVAGIQDMGAAGIICSTSEMSAKAGTGMDIYLDQVPVRQEGMLAWEILISESQERMLLVLHQGKEHLAEEVLRKWDVAYARIGTVTEGGKLRYFYNDKLEAEVPAHSLVLGGGAPVYEREYREPAYFKANQQFDISKIPVPSDLQEVARFLLRRLNLCSRNWITRQYDSMVGLANLSTNRPSDAAVVRLEGSGKSIAVTVDCNPRYVWADPYVGAQIAVAEAARNITSTGAVSSAVTNCLNFGNPYNPEVYWQFVQAIQGMGKACERLETPVTGGNVSFYNQSEEGGAVFPTPTIGMIGLVPEMVNPAGMAFSVAGQILYLIGESRDDISSSEYLVQYHQHKASPAPWFDLEEEAELHRVLRGLVAGEYVKGVHDVSEGGLFFCLLESAIAGQSGFELELPDYVRADAFLFGEAQGRAVVAVDPANEDRFLKYMEGSPLDFSCIGKVTAGSLYVDGKRWGTVSEWREERESVIPDLMDA